MQPELEAQRRSDIELIAIRKTYGDLPDLVRDIDHGFNFTTGTYRGAADELAAAGYRVRTSRSGWRRRFVEATISSDVLPETVDAATVAMVDLAARHSGDYDGWGCVILNTPQSEDSAPA